MAYFQKELAIGTGDSLIDKRLDYAPGAIAGIGGTYADNADKDKSSWGSPLSRINNNYYEFSKKYLYFSFIVNTSNSTEFMAPTNMKFYINGVHLSEIGFGSYAFASRAKSGKMGDPRVLIRVNVPTELLYRFSPITSVGCSIDYSANASKTLSSTWNFDDKELMIYETYYWIKDSADNLFDDDNWYLTNNNSAYAKNNSTYSGQFRAPNTYEGKITLNAIKDNINNNTYFTLNGGTVRVKLTSNVFLNSDPRSRARMPSHIILYSSNGSNLTWPTGYNYINDIVSTSQYVELDIAASYMVGFKDITSAEVYFGGNTNNIISIDIANQSFLNCDLLDNFGLQLNNASGITNEFQKIIATGVEKKIRLKSSLQGSLSKANNCPYNFIDTSSAVLVPNFTGSDVEGVSITSVGALSVEQTYECSNKNGSFLIEDTTLKSGTYKLNCNVLNTLNGKTENKTFIVTNLSIGKNKYIKYVAFKNMDHFFYDENLTYLIPGDIIMPLERIRFFSDVNNNLPNFQIYNLDDGKLVTVDKVYPIFNDNSAKNYISSSSTLSTIKDKTSYSYEDIRSIIGENNSKTTPIVLKYEFYNDDGKLNNVYQNSDSFTLGRKHDVNYSISKTSGTFVKYFFSDCGGDEYDNITTNELIEDRKQGKRYFNLSRQPGEDGEPKEWLSLNFKYKEKNTETGQQQQKNMLFEIPFSKDKLEFALNLLREKATNTIDFSDLLSSHSNYNFLVQLLNTTPVVLEIKLLYVYDVEFEVNTQKLLPNYIVLLDFSTDEIIFSNRISPFGLRKRGVIINPKEKEDLTPTSNKRNTFIINVRDVSKTTDKSEWNEENGLRIVFHTDEKHENDTPITLPVFEVFLDSNGEICFSNGSKIIKPFSQ